MSQFMVILLNNHTSMLVKKTCFQVGELSRELLVEKDEQFLLMELKPILVI